MRGHSKGGPDVLCNICDVCHIDNHCVESPAIKGSSHSNGRDIRTGNAFGNTNCKGTNLNNNDKFSFNTTPGGSDSPILTSLFGTSCNQFQCCGAPEMYPGTPLQDNTSQHIVSQSVAYLGFVEPHVVGSKNFTYDAFIGSIGHYYKVDFCVQGADTYNQMGTLIYVHSNNRGPVKGFFRMYSSEWGTILRSSNVIPQGMISVNATCCMYLISQPNTVSSQSTLDAYTDFIADKRIYQEYNCTYQQYMENIIDKLCEDNSKGSDCEYSVCVGYECNPVHSVHNCISCDESVVHLGNQHVLPTHPNRVTEDYNDHSKTRGFLNHGQAVFEFIGPDREPVQLNSIEEYLQVADIIRTTNSPNYRCARIPIISDLNISAWEKHLQDYHDQFLIQYLKFGFPLSLKCPDNLSRTDITNHFSAVSEAKAVTNYIEKEISLGAMLGPVNEVSSSHFHCSPMLTRPKDGNKRRVILNLSYPQNYSLNDEVDRLKFDNRTFTLKLPVIDDITQAICSKHDPVLFKVDIARAFRNLRADPVDALKFGIKWQDKYFLDGGIAFGWVHGTSAFQMAADAIAHIMKKRGCQLFPYIDDFVGVVEKNEADSHFQYLTSLLQELGLPLNWDKHTPPSTRLTCLGILISIPDSTLSIDSGKLDLIYQECLRVKQCRFLSRKAYQSLLGKLLYIHKCVVPARTFVNRILELFRANHNLKRVELTEEFFKDIEWFLTFLPRFNGKTFFNKTLTQQHHNIFVDACLSGVGALWGDRVYASPVHDIPNFSPTIVHLEMINLVIALRMWGKFWKNSVVTAHCDNFAVVQVVDNSRTRDPLLAACIRNIWLLAATWDIDFKIVHIPGVRNVQADTLSRIHYSSNIDLEVLNDLKTNYIWDVVPVQSFILDLQI